MGTSRTPRLRLLSIVMLLLVTPVLLLSASVPQAVLGQSSDANGIIAGVVPYPTEAQVNMPELVAVKDEADAKLDPALRAFADQSESAMLQAEETTEATGLVIDQGRVQVEVSVVEGQIARVSELIAAMGGLVTGTSLEADLLQAFVPAEALRDLSANENVHVVRVPQYAVPLGELQAGLTTTEGVVASNAQAWHAAGYTGTGVKVAIIDAGFEGYRELLGRDLPATVTAINFADTGTVEDEGDHGTACAEIVHDMAPGATLYLLRIDSPIDLQEAVTYAISQGVKVISTSIGWTNVTPGDGTGFLNDQVLRAKNAGIVWVTAAGNEREKHWGGTFVDTNGNNYHEFVDHTGSHEVNCFSFSAGKCLVFPAGYVLRASVRWDNWTTPVDQDYDLSVVRFDPSRNVWQLVATSDDLQNGRPGQRPVEAVIVRTTGAATMYGVVIDRFKATRSAVNFNLHSNWPLSKRLQERSLSDLGDSPNALTVAALDARPPYPQESYSSMGPTNGPGGTATGGLIKPDFAAFANVNTRAYGVVEGEKFNGTSSATPHVAGAVALMRGAFPAYGWDEVVSFTRGRAIDMGAAGKDIAFGWGRLWLGAAPATSPAPPSPKFKVFLPMLRRG